MTEPADSEGVMICEACEERYAGETCPNCEAEQRQDETMDALVYQASIPNLAALFRKGKKRGLIKAGKEYGSST